MIDETCILIQFNPKPENLIDRKYAKKLPFLAHFKHNIYPWVYFVKLLIYLDIQLINWLVCHQPILLRQLWLKSFE